MHKLYIKIFCLLCILSLIGSQKTYGQIRHIVDHKTAVKNKEKTSAKIKVHKSLIEEDTVYAISTKKQHGWTMPLQVVNRKDIHRYSKIYRFSRKNASGNWCRVECIDGHGRYMLESFQTYVVKNFSDLDSDNKVDFSWKWKIPTVCYIDFIADPLGEKVIQERAYNKSNDLIFSFSLYPINSDGKQYVGNYRDYNGLPSEIRPDKTFSYGTLVYIMRDNWGNDSIIRYMDSKGYAKPNSDGVYSEQLIHDKFGRLIERQSMDSNGQPVNNATGKCGEEYEYDDNNNKIRTTDINADWSSSKFTSELEEISQLFRYDELGRLVEMKSVNQDNKPIENELGTYKVVYEYNDFGDLCLICGFDKDGNLSPYDEEGICKTIYAYDERGNKLEYHNFDALGNPTEGKNLIYFSSLIAAFDPHNNLIKKISYKTDDNTELPNYIFEKQDTVQTTRYSDNSSIVETFSRDGRKVSKVYLDAEGKLDSRRAIEEYVYDVPREEIPYSNQYVSDYVNIEIEKDSNGNLNEISYINQDGSYKIYTRYENDSLTLINGRAYRNKRENRFNNLNGLAHVSYCSEYGFRHAYNEESLYGISSDIKICVFGTDEFNEPSYIIDDSGKLYCNKLTSKSYNDIYLDEENVPIQDFVTFRDDCPKYLCVGVVDSKGYEYGFSENDIIISINNRSIPPYDSDSDFSMKKALMSVLLANEDKNIKVFRIDPVSLEISIKEISIGKGNLEDYGVKLHCYYATSRQHERISTLASGISVSEAKESYKDNKNPIVVLSNSSWKKDRELPYVVQNGRDAVLLAAQMMDFPSIKWSCGDGFEEIHNIIKARGEVSTFTDSIPVLRLFVTNDGKTVKTVEAKKLDLGCQLHLGYVDNDTKEKLNRAANTVAFTKNEDIRSLGKNFSNFNPATKDSLYNRAMVYDTFGLHDISFDVYKKLAAAGYSKALSNLTNCYAIGSGTKKDLRKAEKYAIDAEDGGASLCMIASELEKNGNHLQSEALLRRVSSEDDYYDTALMRLGDLYLDKDSELAKDYYYQSLINSNSIPRNGNTAELISKILKIDSNVSSMDSIYSIGKNLYKKDKDDEAYSVFKTLVDCYYDDALLDLTWCLLYGIGTKSNPDEAVALAEKEFNRSGNFVGLLSAGYAYLGIEQYKKGIDLLTKGCNRGDCQFQANYYLGELYANTKYYGNNTYKAIDYWVKALEKYNYIPTDDQDKFDKIEDFFMVNKSQYQYATAGLVLLGFHYVWNDIYEKGLDLIRIAYETSPDYLSRFEVFRRIYYYAMHVNNIPSMEEYESFMKNKVTVISIPDDVKEDDPLFAYRGKKCKIISLNGWSNAPEGKMINIYDENRNDNELVIEVDSKPVEIRTSKLNPSNITFEEISQ